MITIMRGPVSIHRPRVQAGSSPPKLETRRARAAPANVFPLLLQRNIAATAVVRCAVSSASFGRVAATHHGAVEQEKTARFDTPSSRAPSPISATPLRLHDPLGRLSGSLTRISGARQGRAIPPRRFKRLPRDGGQGPAPRDWLQTSERRAEALHRSRRSSMIGVYGTWLPAVTERSTGARAGCSARSEKAVARAR